MASYVPHASAIPSSISLTECELGASASARPSGSDASAAEIPAWPWCTQPLFFTAAPVVVNVTILNGVSVHGAITNCEFEAAENGQLLDVSFEYGDLWPWTGWLAVSLSVVEAATQWQGIAEGSIVLTIRSDHKTKAPATPESSRHHNDSSSSFTTDGTAWEMTAGGPVEVEVSQKQHVHAQQAQAQQAQQPASSYFSSSTSTTEVLRIPIKVEIIPRPARSLRLLWDQFHSIQYPPGYIPADTDPIEGGPPSSNLDWHGGAHEERALP